MATASMNGFAKFAPSFVPEAIALKFAEGKPVHSSFTGDQIMFTLSDDRKWFADLYVGQKIAELGVEPGQVFEAYKIETRRGNQRIVTVEVAPMKPVNGAASSCQTAAAPSPLQTAPAMGNGSTPPQSTPPPIPVNGAGETGRNQMARCYRDAIDIAQIAVEYAKSKGMLLTPEFADVRALAATLAINECGGRR